MPKIDFGWGGPGPRWGAYSAPQDPLAGGEGASRPLPKNPTSASAFGLDFWPFRPQTSATSAARCAPLQKNTIPPTLGRLEYTLFEGMPIF